VVLQPAAAVVALAAGVLEAHGLHLEVTHVLAAAPAAVLREAITVQLGEPFPRQAGPQVQTVHVLAHRVGQLTCLVQR